MKQKKPRTQKKIFYVAAALFVLMLFSFFIDKYVLSLMTAIQNPVLGSIMNWITNAGSVFVVLIFMTTLFMWEEKKREYIPVLWFSFLAAVLITIAIKFAFHMGRPFGTEHYLFFNILSYSFPSMHTAIAFAAVAVLDREYPMFKWFWVLFACMVAFSRLYIQAHYLSDTIAGALVGFSVGHWFLALEKKHKPFNGFFRKWTTTLK